MGSLEKPKRWDGQKIKTTVAMGHFPPDHLMFTECRDRPAFNQKSGNVVGPVSVENDSKTLSFQRYCSVKKRTVGIGGLLKINGGVRKKQFREPSRVGQKGIDRLAPESADEDKTVWSGEVKGFFCRSKKLEGWGVRHRSKDFFMSISSFL
jgi:hypothetical protein